MESLDEQKREGEERIGERIKKKYVYIYMFWYAALSSFIY
jgi:hypothetical protein